MPNKFLKVYLSAILLLGFFLRLYKLGNYGLWYDEVFSVTMAQNPLLFFKESFFVLNPPFYFILLNAWGLISKSEAFLFMLPLALGVLSLFVIYKLAALMFDRKTGLVSAFLLAISCFHIYYSQELRMYSLVFLLVLLACFFFWKAFAEGKRIYLAAYIFSGALLIYTHYLAAFIFLAHFTFALVFYRQKKRFFFEFIAGLMVIFLLFLPWSLSLPQELNSLKLLSNLPKSDTGFNWMPVFSWNLLLNLFRAFNLGFSADNPTQLCAFILFSSFFIIACLKTGRYKAQTVFLLSWLFIPIFAQALISLSALPVFVFRYVGYILPAYYILVALGILKAGRWLKPLFSLILITILAAASLFNYYNNIFPLGEFPSRPGIHPRLAQRQAAGYILENAQANDIIAHCSRATFQPFRYYHKNSLNEVLLNGQPAKNNYSATSESDKIRERFLSSPIYSFFHAESHPVKIGEIENYPRIWLVYSGWETDKLILDKNPAIWRSRLLQIRKLSQTKEFNGITVYLFE